MATADELTIRTNASAMQMAEAIFGGNITIVDADYDGDRNSSGIWSNGDSISGGLTPSDSGLVLSTGRVRDITRDGGGDPNTRTNTSTNTRGDNNRSDFNSVAGGRTYDASVMEVDFIPDTDILSMQFTFASEEYPEFTGSLYNDVVAVWINGQLVTSPIFEVTQINSVNQTENETLFVDNTGDDYNTEMDGFTVTLRLLIPVNEGEVNTIKFGIADVGDSNYDSALLIAGNSIQGEYIAGDDAQTVFETQTAIVDVLANDGDGVGVAIVTHINGQEVLPGESVDLSSGHVITLQPDGTLAVAPPADLVGLTDPDVVNFSYTSENADGISDTAFVTITTIPCFVRGTKILTDRGDVLVEDLRVGDMVVTRDHGVQPIRWIGSREVAAEGRFAPVVIEAGTFGRHGTLRLSPQHRVMMTHHMAELLFGEDEVLVAAKDLVNDCSVRIEEGGNVEYFHLLFDAHEVIWSNGLLTESFLPGPQTLPGLDDGIRSELLALFPEIDPETGLGYGASALPSLRGYEARALFA
ncbi:2,3,4,5-tetrahydropyridine-2,6-carboxylate N-succinyltransferase [Roseobacter sp. HKCCD9010]|uniref:Hint domain-containing protein n=2 Tax=unclassified Roseobacter TaxID=196798 RepID=UPI001490B67D|nr:MULTISPECIES: Hint domain-containing protein [unclassified Roseobacter]MBF9051116.1 2,3,4,5-tetrahydropyridine-2,6-carboxylate N-succinyltransferase [Rhodobacterales bacterium HKCCD4356]NNW07641.1 2,3,4,5-tetrahydropyridine-2,6-carboxylate N-succinyltransferase [Roseobacter sp. HKCCD8431]NNX27022.1 2,3,4,5-tetrahydropyridine-2,6-carboxylate N-succinyltransferase [Roseobacter sp. HKCCD6925]NNV12885.1 2,3,4,5-tetrahydropyridine-2,6-carboxylate N-succinyltransferase [Roseobacter sp. HKCCD7357]